MWTRITYFARETMVSLRRNVLMTIAGIATVAVSLALFGGILMLSKWVDHGTERIKGGVTLEIFMATDATDQQITDVDTALKADTNVKSFRYLDKQAAYNEFKRIFRRKPDLVSSITAADLPVSFRGRAEEGRAHQDGASRVQDPTRRRQRRDAREGPRRADRRHQHRARHLHRDLAGAARFVAVPHREHDPPRHLSRAVVRSR